MPEYIFASKRHMVRVDSAPSNTSLTTVQMREKSHNQRKKKSPSNQSRCYKIKTSNIVKCIQEALRPLGNIVWFRNNFWSLLITDPPDAQISTQGYKNHEKQGNMVTPKEHNNVLVTDSKGKESENFLTNYSKEWLTIRILKNILENKDS